MKTRASRRIISMSIATQTPRCFVSFLVVPPKCYHTQLENHFEWITDTKQPCNTNCSVCLGESSQFTGIVRRSHITSVLCSTLQMHNSASTPDSLKAAITKRKKDIFVDNTTSAGPIHALLLQLFANRIIKFNIKDNNVIGTDKLSLKHITIQLVYGKDAEGFCKPVYEIDSAWNGIKIE